jgi:hypothetical protein
MKMKFKSKLLGAAVTAALAATSAQAVTVSNDGLGQVLLYPYYTVESGFQTLLSVVNTTARAKAVKVRFLESLNSREVLDFNLYLSPQDVWTGMVTEDATTGGAKLVVAANETSCTVPAISTGIGGAGEQTFLTYGFDGTGTAAGDALATAGAARTRSGYVEIIEMGDIEAGYQLTGGQDFVASVTHSGGVLTAAKCNAVAAEWNLLAAAFPDLGHQVAPPGVPSAGTAGLDAVSGGLTGTGTLINIAKGTDYSYDPVPLAGFNDGAVLSHTEPGNLSPSLAQSINRSDVVRVAQDTGIATITTSTWNVAPATFNGVDAVSAALMRTNVINEYVVNTAIHAGTDWVVTFPTKRWYVDGVANAVRPFSKLFTASGACETITLGFFDQEEQRPTGTIGFSPAPAGQGQSLCWEANVITFNNSKVLASTQTANNVNVGSYPAGWMSLGFPVGLAASSHQTDTTALVPNKTAVSHQMTAPGVGGAIYDGLPVVGFGVQQYVNDVMAGGVLSNYGGSFVHKYLRNIH